MSVTSWHWRRHISRSSGSEMLAVSYYGALSDPPITEYLTVMHEGFAGNKAKTLMMSIAFNAGAKTSELVGADLTEAAKILNYAKPPKKISCRRDGKYHRVIRRDWAPADRARGAETLSAMV
jgi:DNA repair protein RadD